jgi:hypothetical protein
MNVARSIATKLAAIENCRKSNNVEWLEKHSDAIAQIVSHYMPYGSGIDNDTELDQDSTPEKLIFRTSFHHMNDGGYYDGWTTHTVTVRASLVYDLDIKIGGRNRNDIIKDYLYELFSVALSAEVTI